MDSTTKILLWRKDNGRGPEIATRDYELFAREIIKAIRATTHAEIDLRELIDQIRQTLSGTCRGNVHWYVLHVKEDLEQRGWIRTVVNRDHIQIISLSNTRPTLANKLAYSFYNE
jgi:hypothetical protein